MGFCHGPNRYLCFHTHTHTQTPSIGLRQPSLEEGAGKRCSEGDAHTHAIHVCTCVCRHSAGTLINIKTCPFLWIADDFYFWELFVKWTKLRQHTNPEVSARLGRKRNSWKLPTLVTESVVFVLSVPSLLRTNRFCRGTKMTFHKLEEKYAFSAHTFVLPSV